MTRKDYQLIADMINKHIAYWEEVANTEELDSRASVNALRDLSLSFAGELADTNPRFDRKRFLKASGFYAS